MPTLNQLKNMLETTSNELEDRLRKMEQKNHYRNIGYAAQCKVCNHEKVDLIEKLHEEGLGLQEIKDKLDLEMSIMSLSRHFKNHYPKRTRYKLTQKKIMLEEIITIIERTPYLETFFKNSDYDELDLFVNSYGFCEDSFDLCPFIPAKTIGSCTTAIDDIESKLIEKRYSNHSFYRYNEPDNETIDLMNKKSKCLECRLTNLSYNVEILEKLILKEIVGLNLEPNRDKPHNLFGVLSLIYEEEETPFYNDLFKSIESNKRKT